MKRLKKGMTYVLCVVMLIGLMTACGAPDNMTREDEIETGTTQDGENEMDKKQDGKEKDTKQDGSYEYKRDKITADGTKHKVVGILYQPQGTKQDCPVVIVAHGFGANYTYYTDLCEALAKRGIAAVAIEFYGGSKKSLSGGDMEEMTVFTEQQDLEAMMDTVKTLDGIDSEVIYLIGHSQGGFVCTLAAADRPDEVGGMYLIAPAYHIPDAMRETFSSYEEIKSFSQSGNTVGKNYAQAVYDYDIYETMKKYAGKVHIYHGTKDEDVAMEYSERAVETFENATLTKVDGMSHNFFDEIVEELCDEIKADAQERGKNLDIK